MSLDRYRDRAERVAEDNGLVGHHGRENLVLGVQQAIQDFVAHDMEWAALAVEEFARGVVLAGDEAEMLARVVASIRERGR